MGVHDLLVRQIDLLSLYLPGNPHYAAASEGCTFARLSRDAVAGELAARGYQVDWSPNEDMDGEGDEITLPRGGNVVSLADHRGGGAAKAAYSEALYEKLVATAGRLAGHGEAEAEAKLLAFAEEYRAGHQLTRGARAALRSAEQRLARLGD